MTSCCCESLSSFVSTLYFLLRLRRGELDCCARRVPLAPLDGEDGAILLSMMILLLCDEQVYVESVDG